MAEAHPSLVRDLATLGLFLGLFAALAFLPPDTSLSEVRKAGQIRACVPTSYPPLVTGNAAMPGFDVELLQEVAARMGVRLTLNVNASMGQDFNPSSWRLSRAQCMIVAGGVIGSETTRAFIDTTPPHLETGWVIAAPGTVPESLQGMRVGVLVGLAGRNPIALSTFLRGAGATIVRVDSPQELVDGLRAGRFSAVVTEALRGSGLAAEQDWDIAWLQDSGQRDPLTFGLWKGDLTLKRKVVSILSDLEREGVVARLRDKYGIEPISRRFGDGGSA